MELLEKTPAEELLEEIEEYSPGWSYEVGEENVSEDEDFLYLELETPENIGDDFMQLGAYLDARSTAVVNEGVKYVLSVEK